MKNFNEQTLAIKISDSSGKRLVIHGRDVLVECVDGAEYTKRFKTKVLAQEARHLIAIFPSLWKKV